MSAGEDRAVLAALVAAVERPQEWDGPPQLLRVYLLGGRVRLRTVEVPLELWAEERPPVVLGFLAHAMGQFGLHAHFGDGLYGVAFQCETWRVDTPPPVGADSRFQARRVHALALEHQLHSHPQRVETRFMHAVDRYGTTYGAELVRGEARVREQLLMYRDDPGQPVATGAVLDSLDAMVEQLFGVELPERRVPPAAEGGPW